MTTSTNQALLTGLLAIFALVASDTASAEQRFALVIGNSNYVAAPLKNPSNDANLMEATLQQLGFEVTKRLDLGQRDMERAIAKFGRDLPANSVACIFYAGHGLQVDGNNYLVPVDAEIDAKWEVKYETIDQHRVIDMLEESRSRVRMVILDCCLNNPFDRSWRSTRSMGDSRMAPINQAPSGTIILYATGDGQTAADGLGDNSPFTHAVASAFSMRPENGLLLTTAIARVGAKMEDQFGKDQKPFMTVDTAALDFRLYGNAAQPTAVSLQPVTLKPVALKPSAAPVPKLPAPPSPGERPAAFDDSLLTQAREFHNSGKYDLAISAYDAALEGDDADESVRRRARLWRGQAYKHRGKPSDLQMALIDYLAAGQPGLPMTVQADSIELKAGKNVLGRARKHQSVVVSHIQEQNGKTWYYLQSVDRDESLKGWVTAKAFNAKPTPSSRPTSTIASSDPKYTPSNTVPSHSTSRNSSRNYNSNYNSNSNQRQQYQPKTSSGYQGLDEFSRRYKQKNGRPPSIWETPQWESPKDIERLRRQGLIR